MLKNGDTTYLTAGNVKLRDGKTLTIGTDQRVVTPHPVGAAKTAL